MEILSLDGTWTLYNAKDRTPILATVPGCVHTDLIAQGLLPDLFYRDNEKTQFWVGETDWRYTRTFTVEASLLAYEHCLLRCYGLDTLGTLFLNGQVLGQVDNMHRTWEFDVRPYLQSGENLLEIYFDAPMPFVNRKNAEKKMAGWGDPDNINISAWIRKEPCNFGWDWGPTCVTAGIWRSIELVAYNTARLADVLILQNHASQGVTLTVQAQTENVPAKPLLVTVMVAKDGQILTSTPPHALEAGRASVEIPIVNPELWWINRLGAQPLYRVTVVLIDADGLILDQSEKMIGLRTLTLERHTDEWGESFYFTCNGVPFFAKGANWIPVSPHPAQAQKSDYESLIRSAQQANMNMIRAWGGGIYEEDWFYDLCDQYGIAVWQDFMFACGTYPTFDEAFMASVTVEAEQNIRRLRHHACIALWCGNNEIEQGLPTSPGWQESMSWADYSRLFDGVLADLVARLAPQTAYWPGSPHSSVGDRNQHDNPTNGDTHLWSVWHGRLPFDWYRTRPDRFVSEFGFQSFPSPHILEAMSLPEERNITSYIMEYHQRSKIGNGTIIHYMLDWFRLPTSFEHTVWLSQILQGWAMQYAIEHWRRNMPCTMGTLYWQLNDMWPAPSWSSLDWQGNWKALHHMARRFYAPLLVSAVEDVANAQMKLYISNDYPTPQAVELTVTVTDTHGTVLLEEQRSYGVAPTQAHCVHTLDLADCVAQTNVREVMVWLVLRQNGVIVSENCALLTRPKHLSLQNPHIQHTITRHDDQTIDVTLTAQACALYVWLDLAGGQCSDNFFHLRPNMPKTIRVTHATMSPRIYSLYDTYHA